MSREAFEKWLKKHNSIASIIKNPDDTYWVEMVDGMWQAWQACEAEQSKRIASLCELGKSYARIADEKTKQNAELVEALETLKASAIYSKENFYGSVDGSYVIETCEKALASCLTKQKNV